MSSVFPTYLERGTQQCVGMDTNDLLVDTNDLLGALCIKKGEGGRCCIKLESNPEEIDTEVAIYYILLLLLTR